MSDCDLFLFNEEEADRILSSHALELEKYQPPKLNTNLRESTTVCKISSAIHCSTHDVTGACLERQFCGFGSMQYHEIIWDW